MSFPIHRPKGVLNFALNLHYNTILTCNAFNWGARTQNTKQPTDNNIKCKMNSPYNKQAKTFSKFSHERCYHLRSTTAMK